MRKKRTDDYRTKSEKLQEFLERHLYKIVVVSYILIPIAIFTGVLCGNKGAALFVVAFPITMLFFLLELKYSFHITNFVGILLMFFCCFFAYVLGFFVEL